MLKKILATILLFGSVIAYGQTVKVSFGIRGGADAVLENTEIMPKSKMQIGGGGGAFVGLKFGRVVGISADLLYSYKGAKYSPSINGSSISLKHSFLNIPLCLQLWCGRGFAFELGYQQSVALKGELVNSGKRLSDKGILDYGSALAGIIVNMGNVVFLNVRYTKALGKTYVMTSVPNSNMAFHVGLGFRLYTNKQSAFKK